MIVWLVETSFFSMKARVIILDSNRSEFSKGPIIMMMIVMIRNHLEVFTEHWYISYNDDDNV